MVNDATPERLRALAGHRNGHPVLSVFLDLDPSTKPHPAARQSAIDSVLHDARHAVEDRGLDHDDLVVLRGVLERLEQELTPTGIDSGVRGIAVFGPTADGVDVLRLPAPVPNLVCLDAGPHIEPLVGFAVSETWCVALIDRSGARFHLGTEHQLDAAPDLDELAAGNEMSAVDEPRADGADGMEAHHHYGNISRALLTALEQKRFDRLILGGQQRLHNEVEDRLHGDVRKRLSGWINVDHSAVTVTDVHQAALELMRARRHEHEKECLDRLQQNVGSLNGLGVHGTEDVLTALNESRVDVLMLTSDWHPSGAYDPTTGMVAAGEGESIADGLPLAPADDLAELAIAKAYEQGASVLLLDDPRLQSLGSVGAILRF